MGLTSQAGGENSEHLYAQSYQKTYRDFRSVNDRNLNLD